MKAKLFPQSILLMKHSHHEI